MVRKRQEERQEGDQETLCGDSSSPPGEQRQAQEEEATPDPDSSSPSPDPPPPHQVSTSSQKKERLRQVVIRWMETNEEANDPDQVIQIRMIRITKSPCPQPRINLIIPKGQDHELTPIRLLLSPLSGPRTHHGPSGLVAKALDRLTTGGDPTMEDKMQR
ncbi:unnamed protein product [Gadus morhua 'NCC']